MTSKPETTPVYFHFLAEMPIAAFEVLKPFNAVILIEQRASPEWRRNLCNWLIRNQCNYAMCWGTECELWHDDLDWAVIDAQDEGLFPEEYYVMTTWHDGEPLLEVLWFAQNCARRDDIASAATYIFHIAAIPSEERLASVWKYAQSEDYAQKCP